MEFEKLKDIIVDVMGCNPDEITMDTDVYKRQCKNNHIGYQSDGLY